MNVKKLNDICLNITDGTHSTVKDDNKGSGYLLSCKNVKDGKIIFDENDRKINDSTLSQLRKRTKMSIGDVVLTTVGTIGESSIINFDNPIFEFQRSVAILKANSSLILPEYLHYFFVSQIGQSSIKSRIKGAAQPCLFLNDLKDIEINLPFLSNQQHIVNTIGSVDNLIENINKQNEKLMHIGLMLINSLNDSLEHKKLLVICELIKGFEIGSQNYIETSIDESLIHYLRVGDLLSLGGTFVEPSDELMMCTDDDILIAFDGAPGRNAVGLEGAYSSGIYKVKCNTKYKGLIYFEINSELNQKIIKDHSQGTTILHASKAIPFLETAKTDDRCVKKLNTLFERIIQNKRKLKLLVNEKRLLLSKYF